MDNQRTLILACATVIEDMLPLLPEGMRYQVFDFGLHIQPEKLRTTLQDAVNSVDETVDTILLGYGLCSQAVIGITSQRCTLVVPRVDDCIAIFLGTRSAYVEQCKIEPGTYYLTKGWIEVGSTPFSEYEGMVKRYGPEKAARIQKIMLNNYKRLALIDTGQSDMGHYREYSLQTAERFDLRFEEIKGSNEMIKKMIAGDWNDEFVVVPPGETISYEHFFTSQVKS
ncbi:MAG: DUF1638 domain-containing protein [Anaerolineaceae bacterium]